MTTTSEVQLLKHPGPVAPKRLDVMAGHNQKTWRITLQRGKTLYGCVTSALTKLGIHAGALNIEHVTFGHISYFLIASSPDVEPVAHYTTPLELNERAMLVGAGATIGQTDSGKPAIHCHGLLVTESGRQVGGHLLTEKCTIAEDGVAYISALDFMDLVIGVDPEIATPVFQPKYCEAMQ